MQPAEKKHKNKRIITVGFLLALIWLGMTARIFNLQVLKRHHYAGLAVKQSVRRNIIPPQRGEIYDRNGEKLVMNASVKLKSSGEKEGNERQLKRVAPFGHLAGQVLGNIGRDGYGQLGLEYDQDKVLRGTDGWKYARYDVARRYHPGFAEQKKAPVDGLSLVTTLDAKIQRIAEQALERGLKRVDALMGTAIIIHPPTGDIIAMANYPFYDPNLRHRSDLTGWKNSAISKVYEPGSTFKIITASSVIEEGFVQPRDTFFAEDGVYRLNRALIKDTKPRGNITFAEAMAYSSNIVMVKAALRLDPQTLYQYIRSFGFGMKTGIALPAEEGGSFKTVKHWSSRTQITLAWGQEIGATPLQVAMACAAIANNGVLMKPRIIKEQKNSRGKTVKEILPRRVRQVVSAETADKLRKMLASVVEMGTARKIYSERYPIAGKTGTAEKIDEETGQYQEGKFHSSFVGMVPVDDPEYVCLVLLDEPKKDKHGGSCAAPIFRDIMERIISIPGSRLAARMGNTGMAPETLSSGLPSSPLTLKFGNSLQNIRKAGSSLLANQLGRLSWTDNFNFLKGKGLPEIKKAEIALTKNDPGMTDVPSAEEERQAEGSFSRCEWRMPDVRSLSLRDALLKLKDLDVKIKYQGTGRVIMQSPAPAALVKKGTVCRLRLRWKS
ncbi:penicillin-binding protein [Fibrobacterota bacterium]